MSSAATLPSGRLRVGHRFLRDERVAELAGEGDASAFAVIFERHHQAVYRYSRSIVRDPDDASDVLQSTMVNALRALPDREGDVNVRAWLFRVAHNEAVSVLRRRRVQTELSNGDAGTELSVEDTAVARERLDELLGDLAGLPERQRSALVMRELNGLSYAEVAEALDLSEVAARQAAFEARSALVDHAQGRDAPCVDVRRSLGHGDRRVLRRRSVRSHLRACEPCREFEAVVDERRRELGALVPALSPAAAAGVLEKVLAGAGLGSGGAAGGGLAVLLGGGNLLVGGAVKTVAVVAVAAAGTGAGGVGVARALDERDANHRPAPSAERALPHPVRAEETPQRRSALRAQQSRADSPRRSTQRPTSPRAQGQRDGDAAAAPRGNGERAERKTQGGVDETAVLSPAVASRPEKHRPLGRGQAAGRSRSGWRGAGPPRDTPSTNQQSPRSSGRPEGTGRSGAARPTEPPTRGPSSAPGLGRGENRSAGGPKASRP